MLVKLNPEFAVYLDFFFCKEEDYSVVSTGHLSFDCCSYCGRSHRMLGLLLHRNSLCAWRLTQERCLSFFLAAAIFVRPSPQDTRHGNDRKLQNKIK